MKTIDLERLPEVSLEGYRPLPENQQVIHRVRGFWQFSQKKVGFYLAWGQGRTIEGASIFANFVGINVPVFSVQVCDFFSQEENQHLAPDFMRDGRRYYFWGTIFEKDGLRFVKFMRWKEGKFMASFTSLDSGFDENYPALVDLSKVENFSNGMPYCGSFWP